MNSTSSSAPPMPAPEVTALGDRPLVRLWQRTREQELAVDGPAPRGHVRARAQHRAQRQTIAALAENGKTMREIVAATDLHASYVVRALAVEGFAAAQ